MACPSFAHFERVLEFCLAGPTTNVHCKPIISVNNHIEVISAFNVIDFEWKCCIDVLDKHETSVASEREK